MKFDPTKPVRTRDGRPARIVVTDLKGFYEDTILALVKSPSGREYTYTYTADGSYVRDDTISPHDLINVPERTETFQNVYLKSVEGKPASRVAMAAYTSLENAATARRMTDHIGTIKTVLEDGKLVSVEIVDRV